MELLHESDVHKLEKETLHLTNNHVFFPELVWESVLDKIKKPLDIESCSNASPYFWKFLETRRQTRATIPHVLHQMSRFFHQYQSVYDDDESQSDNGKVSMKDFWKLRQICKSWNSTIEHFHHSTEAGHFEMKSDMEEFENQHLRDWANQSFDSEDHPHQFLLHFESTHFDLVEKKPKKNPFLGRSVHFNDLLISRHMPDIYHMYLDGLQELVTRYGTEILYVSFLFREVAGINVTQIYSCVRECLKRMPNLKVLRVLCRHEDIDGDEATQAAFQEYRETCRQALLNDIVEKPIPTMPQLKYIWTKDLPVQIFNELLQRNRHVNKLKVERKEHHGDYTIFERELPNLTALHLNFCSEEDFMQFENCEFPLKLERFYFGYNGPSELLSWSRLFRVLETQVGETCTELLIKMPSPKTENESVHIYDDTHYDRLNLPNLKQIAVACDSAVALDFMLPAKKSLRAIYMKYFKGDEDEFLLKRFTEYEDKQLVEWIGFKERMEESNIWAAFPKLKRFDLFRKNEMGGCLCCILRACSKNKRYFDIRRWYSETN